MTKRTVKETNDQIRKARSLAERLRANGISLYDIIEGNDRARQALTFDQITSLERLGLMPQAWTLYGQPSAFLVKAERLPRTWFEDFAGVLERGADALERTLQVM